MCTGGGPLQIAIDLCSDGDLLGLLKEDKLSFGEIARATIDVADAMLFLSSSCFVHRDLAARNVSPRGVVTLGPRCSLGTLLQTPTHAFTRNLPGLYRVRCRQSRRLRLVDAGKYLLLCV